MSFENGKGEAKHDLQTVKQISLLKMPERVSEFQRFDETFEKDSWRGDSNMTVFVRKENCSVCKQPMEWNDQTKRLRCGCGVFKASFVNLRDFKRVMEAKPIHV